MRIAVLGLGFMGSTHLKALRSVQGAELAALYSGDPAKLAGDLTSVQGNLGGPGERFDFSTVRKYSDIGALLADQAIDAVDLCLPTHLHAPMAIQALRAGKHVFVEKPMALNAAEAAAMIREAETQHRTLMTAQVLRFFPAYQALRESLAANGSPLRWAMFRWAMFRRRSAAPAWSKWLADPQRSGGGVFDLLIHDVDMCLHLFGPPRAVSASGYEALANGIDLLSAELYYPDGATALVTGGWHHPTAFPFSMEYTVVTDGATFEYDSDGRPPALYRANGTKETLPLPERDGYAAELQYFIDCCRSGARPDLCPPEESAQAVALTRLLLEARERNGERIECNL